jgi:lipoate-protein ligase A
VVTRFCSYADFNTLFVSFISRAKDGLAAREPPYPNAIMQWSAAWYGTHCFQNLQWGLQSGQDYAVGDRKVGGNAQSFGGGRWVHHTSFLHDADHKVMAEMLSLPKKQPEWRKFRDHRCAQRSRAAVALRPGVTAVQGIFDHPSRKQFVSMLG